MKRTYRSDLSLLAFFVTSLAAAAPPAVQLCEPWQSEYAGEDATGKHVIALWQFHSGEEPKDSSGHGHELAFQGAKANANGRFGGALESAPGWPVADERHAAVATPHPDLSPKGPFTIELWIQPKPELNNDYPEAFLIDKKYVADDDYQLILGAADRNGSRILRAVLGFGSGSETWHAEPTKFEPGAWNHLAFTYDGAGTGAFYINGVPAGRKEIAGRKSLSPGKHPLSIGDRVGSYYHGFPGLIDQVRLSNGVREFRRAKFERTSDRAVFIRRESGAAVRFTVTNLQRAPLAAATVSIDTDGLARQETKITDLAPGSAVSVDYPIQTQLRPAEYAIHAELAATAPEAFRTKDSFTVRLVTRPLPNQFPVLMWGLHGGILEEIQRLKRIGFTHALGFGADYGAIFEAGKPTSPSTPETVEQNKKTLDAALADNLTVVASLSPGSALGERKEFLRVNRKGETYTKDICGLFPEIQKYCYNVGASVAQAYSPFPAFGAAMVHTEVRDGANCCFHPHDSEAFRKSAGVDIPPEISAKWGVDFAKLANFPASRVIPDDHPIYVYYKWFWKTGDGWNGLNSELVRGLKSTGKKGFWTYHDPAVRVAKVYGSGGEVDVISQWTYSYPDPIRIAVATEELLAMAKGKPGQDVMKMTQIIWYRSQTAPEPRKPEDELPYKARWEIEQPEAPFITIAPMHMREAFWTKIARPIRGIMYHGWQSLVPCEPPGGYRYTHPETQNELARLVRQVVRPLGPTLLAVPGVKSDVAFLESFASEMFAHRGTYGWSGKWQADAFLVSLWAHLQPEIVFDETVAEKGLDGYRVLVMADCDVLTESVAARVKQFQAAGGIVIGDERLAPAIKPDIVLPAYERTGKAKEDKAALVALAAELRKKLDARYRPYADTSTPDVVPYVRRYKDTDYVFVVNDRREYGDYVGHHGLVMENGLPSAATLAVRRPAGYVYDLVEHKAVATRSQQGHVLADIALGPCDGRVYMVTSRPIQRVAISGPESIERGNSGKCLVGVLDAENKPIDAVVPVEVTIRDSAGGTVEFSGSYGAADGKLEIPLDIAPNDPIGIWQVEARELASGRTAVHYLRVPGPTPWPPAGKAATKDAANPVQPKG
ncbi:MAG: LamG domain-containing protein [Pirellulales bacterium]|nr:LamG domain-containing protein [Pirellulales bacterium]